MVLIITGTADSGTALREMRRWREPSEIATTFAFFVAHPMKTGRRRSSECGPSASAVQTAMDQKTYEVEGHGAYRMQDLRSPALGMPSRWPTTFLQPCDDVSVGVGELDETTNTSLTSGCLRFVSLDRDYGHLSIRVEKDNRKSTPAAPSRGKPTNSSRIQIWVCFERQCAVVSATRPDVSTGVLVTVITW